MDDTCKHFYPINDKYFIYLEGSETRPEGWRKVIYVAKYVCLKEPGENGGGGVALLDDIQAIAKHVYVDLMRKLEQAVDVRGSSVKVCQDFHIETTFTEEESSLHLDIFGPRSEGMLMNHEDMITILSFKEDILSTLDAPLSENRCSCHTNNSFLFYKCSKDSINNKEQRKENDADDAGDAGDAAINDDS